MNSTLTLIRNNVPSEPVDYPYFSKVDLTYLQTIAVNQSLLYTAGSLINNEEVTKYKVVTLSDPMGNFSYRIIKEEYGYTIMLCGGIDERVVKTTVWISGDYDIRAVPKAMHGISVMSLR